jgi:hypothetical protein
MKYFVASALLALACAAPAQATETLTQTVTITPAAAPTSATINFDQFDPTWGSLQSIMLSFSSSLNATGTATNNSNVAHSYTLTKGASASLTGNGFSFTEILASGTANLGTIAKKTTITLAPITGSASDSATLLSGFAPFLGTGDVSFSYASTNGFSLSHPSMLNLLASIGGSATITYHYELPTPPTGGVPEPTSWAMMFMGFIALGAAMRRSPRVSLAFASSSD